MKTELILIKEYCEKQRDCKFCPMYQGYYANEKRCIWNRLPFVFDVELMCNMYERIKNETIWEMKNHENKETVENR